MYFIISQYMCPRNSFSQWRGRRSANSTFPNATDSCVGHLCIHLKGRFWILSETKEGIQHTENLVEVHLQWGSQKGLSACTQYSTNCTISISWSTALNHFSSDLCKVLNTGIFSGKKKDWELLTKLKSQIEQTAPRFTFSLVGPLGSTSWHLFAQEKQKNKN